MSFLVNNVRKHLPERVGAFSFAPDIHVASKIAKSNPLRHFCTYIETQNNATMKLQFLTLDYIKQHSRICGDCEDEILVLYAKGAENNLLRLCDRTYDELVTMGGGTFPEELMIAGLMLVDVLYSHRSPQEAINLSDVGYTFDFYTKPFMKL